MPFRSLTKGKKVKQNKLQAAQTLGAGRAYVYSGFSQPNHYPLGSAHNVYRVFCQPKHNILGWVPGQVARRPETLAPCYADTLEPIHERIAGAVAITALFLLLAFI